MMYLYWWSIEDLEDMCLKNPTKGFISRVAALERWEFADSHQRYEFRVFVNDIPGV
jgi:hypothetical protein